MARILVVDDEESICWSLQQVLQDAGHDVATAPTAERALRHLSDRPADLVMLDVRMPGMDGLTAMRHIRDNECSPPVVVMTAFGSLQTAVSAFDNGAVEYLPKPFDAETAVALAERILDRSRAEWKTNSASTEPPHQDETSSEANHGRLVGASSVMQEVFKRIALVAPTESPVLITGESGSGKELVARAVHDHSRRAAGPFIPVNLAALSQTLIESELFGHVKGAFTGADHDRAGVLQLAEGGTVFLDELGDVPLGVQVKLLRVLEQREFTPVGANQPRRCQARFVAATSRNLQKEIAAEKFREDFYFRLAVFQIELPPLRRRPEDIPALAEYFLRAIAGANAGISTEALQELSQRDWPGNVRELRNTLETALILARGGIIAPVHLPPPALRRRVSPNGPGSLQQRLAELVAQWTTNQLAADSQSPDLYARLLEVVEPPLLEEVMRHFQDNRLRAAECLGLHRATLRKKLNGQQADDDKN